MSCGDGNIFPDIACTDSTTSMRTCIDSWPSRGVICLNKVPSYYILGLPCWPRPNKKLHKLTYMDIRFINPSLIINQIERKGTQHSGLVSPVQMFTKIDFTTSTLSIKWIKMYRFIVLENYLIDFQFLYLLMKMTEFKNLVILFKIKQMIQ